MPDLHTPDFIYRTAKEYFQIGTVAAGEFLKDFIYDPYSYCKIQAPAVNISFSLELALKAILLHEIGRIPKERHNLPKLYKHIPEQSREKIVKYFTYNLSKGNHFPLIRYKKTRSKEENSDHNFTTIEAILLHHQNAFQDWRYAHEFPTKESDFLEFDFHAMVMVASACFQYLEKDVLT